MALTPERIDEIAGPADYFDRRVFARAVEAEARRDALEEAAKEFDKRAVLLDGGPAVGWYEPNEPAEIVRKLKEDFQ